MDMLEESHLGQDGHDSATFHYSIQNSPRFKNYELALSGAFT
jgi:hypothetical protein